MKKSRKMLLNLIGFFYRKVLNNSLIGAISRVDPQIMNKNKKRIITVHERPNVNFVNKLTIKENYHEYAIVVQGPVVYNNNFTLTTLKIYVDMFPDANLILSTWEDTRHDFLSELKDLPVTVLLNKLPYSGGLLNINFQLTSTINGLNAVNKSVKYVLKTRTDTRIYSKNALIDMKNLLDLYLPNITQMNRRIIGIDSNTPKYIPFNFSDVMQFGDINDVKKYWDHPIVNTKKIVMKDYLSKNTCFKDFYDNPNPEIILFKSFLDRIDIQHNNTYDSYHKVIKDMLIIIDKEMINHYWFKYSSNEYYWSYKYGQKEKYERIRYLDWLRIYNGVPPTNFYEFFFTERDE